MKMFFLIYDAVYDEDVIETLSACNVKGFTKWSRVLGHGERSDPKMDDSVWPGYNCSIMLAVDRDKEPTVFEALQSLHQRVEGKGFRVFGWPLERVI